MKWIRDYWHVAAGIAALLFLMGQGIYRFASVRSGFEADAKSALDVAEDANSRVRRHEEKDGHEKSARTLIRIETEQKAMRNDVNRLDRKLDSLDSKLDRALGDR